MVSRFNAQFAFVGDEVFQPDAYFDLDSDAQRYVAGQLVSNPRLDRGQVFDTVSGVVVFVASRGDLLKKSETSPKGS